MLPGACRAKCACKTTLFDGPQMTLMFTDEKICVTLHNL